MSSKLPESVRAALEAAEAEYKELYGGAQVVNAPEPGDAPVVVNAPEPGLPGVQEDSTPPAEPQAQAPTEPPPGEPTTQAPTPAQEDPFEHKYKVLQGKYNSEVPQLRTQLQQAQSQLTQAMSSVDALTRKVDELTQALGKRQQEDDLKLTPEEESAFGKDLIELTRKIAAAEAARAAKEAADKAAKVEQTVQRVAQTAESVAQERFLGAVEQGVPDWQAINSNDRWLAWLGEYDPLLGMVRQSALDQATAERNAQRVVAIFNAFKATLPAAPAAAPQNPAQPLPVVPRTAATSVNVQSAPPQRRIFTEAEIKALFDARRRGEITAAQWPQVSAEIDAAVAEGRVR